MLLPVFLLRRSGKGNICLNCFQPYLALEEDISRPLRPRKRRSSIRPTPTAAFKSVIYFGVARLRPVDKWRICLYLICGIPLSPLDLELTDMLHRGI
jgi:hypothetical protein